MRQLSRRTLLKSAGTAVALPLLDAMLPSSARAQMTAAPRRMLVYFVPNGIHMPAWTPAEEGAGFALTPILSPLEPVKNDLLVLTGLANRPGIPDGPGDHAAGTGSFLTATHCFKTEGANIQNAQSMDQLAAGAIGGSTRFPSLQLGAEGGGGTGNCDSGYSCAYSRNISWAGPATPLSKEVNPAAVFDRLFRGIDPGSSGSEREKRKRNKMSVLDFVRGDSDRLRAKLGAGDRVKLDEHLTGVRELEKRLMMPDGMSCNAGARPEDSADVRARVQAMADLMVLAFQCDLTRVITFMLANAASNRVYTFLGIGDGHHQISHHQDNPVNFAQLTTIDTWEVSQLAYLLQRMKAVQEGERTLLDNSVVMFSSEIEDGNAHRHTNLPVLLAGRCGGALSPGRHVIYREEHPIANLFVSLLGAVGVQVDRFGADGTAPLEDLG